MISTHPRKTAAVASFLALALMGAADEFALADHVPASKPSTAAPGPRLVMPIMNPERGKWLFVSKGCVGLSRDQRGRRS